MPEGHTIHRLARDHTKALAGQKIEASSPQGRFTDGAERIDGRRLERIDAWGKHLCYWFERKRKRDEPVGMHIHLGLYGKFRLHRLTDKNGDPKELPEPRGAVRVRVVGETASFDLNGPNTCEIVTPDSWQAITERLGEDPLRDDCDAERLWDRVSKSRAAIGAMLLNQSVFAGVGNIFRCDSLHACGIHPEREARSLSREEFDDLWRTISRMLQIGVKRNRIITIDAALNGERIGRPNRSESLRVYKKDRCPTCGGPITSWEQAGRAVFACSRCQPADPN
ncbi:DNA-formamidopyrimidine glycosylase family protein [Phycisphaerales bacterium ac7]